MQCCRACVQVLSVQVRLVMVHDAGWCCREGQGARRQPPMTSEGGGKPSRQAPTAEEQQRIPGRAHGLHTQHRRSTHKGRDLATTTPSPALLAPQPSHCHSPPTAAAAASSAAAAAS